MPFLLSHVPSLRCLAAWDVAWLVPIALVAWAAWELRGSWQVGLGVRERRLAAGFGVAVLGLHLLLALIVAGASWAAAPEPGAGTRLLESLNLVVSAGIFQAAAGGLLLAATLSRRSALPGANVTSDDSVQLLPWLFPEMQGTLPRRRNFWGTVAESAAWLAAALAYSGAWMALARHLVGAHTSPTVETQLENPGGGLSLTAVWAAVGMIVLAPLFEEVAFRGFLLDRLRGLLVRRAGNLTPGLPPRAVRRIADGVAVFVTAVVWALAHVGRVEPEWVKWVQIFGLGLVLGVLRLRRGLEACVVVHLLFNFPGSFLFASGQ